MYPLLDKIIDFLLIATIICGAFMPFVAFALALWFSVKTLARWIFKGFVLIAVIAQGDTEPAKPVPKEDLQA